MKSIFIFRRDIRLFDNTGLHEAIKHSQSVLPIFIFTPEQLVNNKYRSNNGVQFMIESLYELDNNLKKLGSKLYYFFGRPDKIVDQLIKSEKIDAVFANCDYTNYSKKRDKKLEKVCEKNNIQFKLSHDYLLKKPGSVMTGNKTPYVKFTPFMRTMKKLPVDQPVKTNFYQKLIKTQIELEYIKDIHSFYTTNNQIAIHGGRKNAMKILTHITKFNEYNKKRDDLTYNTTHLSAYIKFGCLSIREVYHAIFNSMGNKNKLIDQLYWRDFYSQISFYYPHIYQGAMRVKYNKLKWSYDSNLFNKWKNGQTGYPLVDAGMRQLNKTGFMHNRTRLITSNFLVKVLHINWQEGERYYATQLVDYDPAVNNGNWQWSASTGTDAQPYFRIFNPWLQSKKHDPDAIYIKKWVPELITVSTKDIHQWFLTYTKYKINYFPPCVDFHEQVKKTLNLYISVN